MTKPQTQTPPVKTIAKALTAQAIIPAIVPPAVRECAYEEWAKKVLAALVADGHLDPPERR